MRTKRTKPPRAFLSERMALTKVAGETRGQAGQGSEAADQGDDTGYVIGTRQSKLMPRNDAAIIPQATASPCR